MRTLEEIENSRIYNDGINIWYISYDEYKIYREIIKKSTRRIIYDIPCSNCGKLFSRNSKLLNKSFKSRTNETCRNEIFCSATCASKFFSKTKEFRIKNSKAQLKIQGTEEQKTKNRKGVLFSRQNEEVYKRWIDGIRKASRSEEYREKKREEMTARWKSPIEREKFLNNGRFFTSIHGDFISKFSGEIRYESSYELIFLFICDLNRRKVERFDIPIEYYYNEVKHRYYPDFFIDGDIFEIKSNYLLLKKNKGEEVLEEKNKAAETFVKNSSIYKSFRILFEEELSIFCNCSLYARKYIYSWLKKDGFLKNCYGGNSLAINSDYNDEYGNDVFKKAKEKYLLWNSLR
jgi:hypothetical protein